MTGLGVDEVHLGVMMVLNLMIGMITPPIGQTFRYHHWGEFCHRHL